MSEWEDRFFFEISALGLPHPERQYKFHPSRKWRMDFFWKLREDCALCVEIQGGIYANGRHSRGAGYEKDMEKWNEAVLMGYDLFIFGPTHIKNGMGLEYVKRWLKKNEKNDIPSLI